MARLDYRYKPLFGNVGPRSSDDRTGAEIEPITSNSYVTYVLHTAMISNIESRNPPVLRLRKFLAFRDLKQLGR